MNQSLLGRLKLREGGGLHSCLPRPAYNTGLPTKDETSETTVRDLYFLFPYIHDSLQL